MRLQLQEGQHQGEIVWRTWQLALHGAALDDRGQAVLAQVAGNVAEMKSIEYEPNTLEVNLDGKVLVVDELSDALRTVSGRVLLEATTLGFAEIVLCCKALHALGHDEFDIVYVEPKVYQRHPRDPLLSRRDFELSSEVPGYQGIPGNTLLLGDRKPIRSVFFLGYEEARLRRAFEELQMLSPGTTSVTLGVPAFKAGWEMDAMANNISVIREQNIRGGVHFCGAEDPYAVFELLNEVYGGLRRGERLVVAPIGTKPHGIGVALFAAVNHGVGIIYDHPQRTHGRSSDVGHWHLFSIEQLQATP
ncbi:MAG: hypothetical protein KDB27_15875 [Planctomycetales bacterium]|nr:hypothetical protein [Planctomycetales bacterium]